MLLDFDIEQVALDHQKFDDLSITWNTIDPTRAITDSYLHLAWGAEPLPQLTPLPGQPLRQIALLEGIGGDMADGSIAVGFAFPSAHLTIFNALDENGLEHSPPGPNYRHHPITP